MHLKVAHCLNSTKTEYPHRYFVEKFEKHTIQYACKFSTVMVIIFWDFFMFDQIFLSPLVKQHDY